MSFPQSVPVADMNFGLGGAARQRLDGRYFHNARLRPDRPHAVLQLTLGGAGYYHPDSGKRTLLPAGSAFVETIPGPFSYGWAAGTYDLVYVAITGPAALSFVQTFHGRYGATVDLGRDTTVARTMLGLASFGRRTPPADPYLVSGQLYGVLMQLMSVLSRQRILTTPLAAECLRLIQARAQEPSLNVAALAATLDCSREHLTREFRKATGTSLSAYLTLSRVRLAARHLRGKSGKLESVARQSGFGSASYFCRVFKSVVGTTPAYFRERPWIVVP